MKCWTALVLCGVLAGCASPIRADTNLPVDPALRPNKITLRSGDGTMISGYLYRPPTQEARPAVLMMHGCSGLLTKKYGRLKSRETAWRDIFLAEGYVVLLLDSFTERGQRSICKVSLSDRPIEPNRERPHDAYGALQWLQSNLMSRRTRSCWAAGRTARCRCCGLSSRTRRSARKRSPMISVRHSGFIQAASHCVNVSRGIRQRSQRSCNWAPMIIGHGPNPAASWSGRQMRQAK